LKICQHLVDNKTISITWAGKSPMTIRRLLKNSSLSPEGVNRLVAAYQKTLRGLDLVDRHDPVAEIVAKKVIEIGATTGDPVEISRKAVRQLGCA